MRYENEAIEMIISLSESKITKKRAKDKFYSALAKAEISKENLESQIDEGVRNNHSVEYQLVMSFLDHQ